MRQLRLSSLCILLAALQFLAPATYAEESLLSLLNKDGHVALMRHALAPGTGDPGNFALRDCTTQRNLDARGRTQAAETGEYFRRNGIEFGTVYSSQWCRCLETARLLGPGPVVELPFINSFFEAMHLSAERTGQWQSWLAAQTFVEPVLFVTHQVNISALTGVYPRSGEVVIVKVNVDGTVTVAGRISPR